MSPAIDYARLAELYDALVRFEDDLPFFLEESLRSRGPVLELMCGTGRVSVSLAEAGVDLTCVDSSPAMLRQLRRKLDARGLGASVIEHDVTRLDFEPRFALAFIAFNSFEELLTLDEQRATLAGVRRSLLPAGRLVCTLHNPSTTLRSLQQGPRVVASLDRDDRRITLEVDVRHDEATGLVSGTERLITYSRAGERIGSEDLELCYRLTDEAEFRSLVGEAGLSVVEIFGDYDRAPFHRQDSPSMIWILGA